MTNVIPLHGDPHEATQRLLPWYVTGRLDAADHALVTQHLAQCAECRGDLDGETRLRAMLATLPPVMPDQWDALRTRALAADGAESPAAAPPRARWPRWVIGTLAQAAVIALCIGTYDVWQRASAPDYTALASPSAAARGNMLVMFHPDMREAALRANLRAIGARLVDGPTAAGAYVLAVPAERRDDALATLRARDDIMLAEPLGEGAGP